MYVEELNKNQYRIYVNNKYFFSLNWNDKEEISKNVKKLVFKLDQIYHLSLSGFYKMSIYLNKDIGMMIELNKLEDFGIDIKTIDLKIVIYMNSEFLLETNDLGVLEKCNKVYSYQSLYYGCIANLEEKNLLNLIEWGRFIYGDKVEKIKRKGKKIQIKKV